ncbi:MAG: hypothetical protein HC892_19580 [Saprospiraceae bacterium]|nr:hypothetical protein [Saprospiraceae bacterium]
MNAMLKQGLIFSIIIVVNSYSFSQQNDCIVDLNQYFNSEQTQEVMICGRIGFVMSKQVILEQLKYATKAGIINTWSATQVHLILFEDKLNSYILDKFGEDSFQAINNKILFASIFRMSIKRRVMFVCNLNLDRTKTRIRDSETSLI